MRGGNTQCFGIFVWVCSNKNELSVQVTFIVIIFMDGLKFIKFRIVSNFLTENK